MRRGAQMVGCFVPAPQPRYHKGMATTQDILNAARDLGKLIATHEAARKFDESIRKLQGDVEAQRVLNDYNRQVAKLGEKEAGGKPIEVEDKRQLQNLQGAVMRNPTLRDFQLAQMDYVDLMRKVDEAMSGEAEPAAAAPQGTPAQAPGAAPIINPEVIGKIRRDQ